MRGDHLVCSRFGGVYSHHGIDLGDDRVVHYSGEPGRKEAAKVQVSSLAEFAAGDKVKVLTYGACDEPEVVVSRAMSRIGETRYHLVTNNCEHFARWCKTGDARSKQVRNGAGKAATTTVAGIGTVGAIGAVSTAGAVAGLSGPGFMAGFAAIGGSAVGGIALLGAAPGLLGSAVLSNTVFKDDPHAPESERNACSAARKATIVGTAAGAAGAIGAVSAAGTVSGLSAAGITSGLAAIGGGMVAGTAIAVAAPLVGAVAVSTLVYGLMKWRKRRS